MGRRRRVFIRDVSMHVVHRGHGGTNVFRMHADYEMYLHLLRESAIRRQLSIHAYALMTNHVHLLVTPRHALSLPRGIQDLAGHYSRYFNYRYGRTGTLWNGRYRDFLIEDESYWYTCLKYVEQNPRRAGMVSTAAEYRWSSYRAHAFGHGQSGSRSTICTRRSARQQNNASASTVRYATLR
jgi:putative transposase